LKKKLYLSSNNKNKPKGELIKAELSFLIKHLKDNYQKENVNLIPLIEVI